MTRQEAMLKLALRERGMPIGFEVDHMAGTAVLAAGVEVGLVYPISYRIRSYSFMTVPKTIRFLFVGFGGNHGRVRLLTEFAQKHDDVRVQFTEKGRDPSHKADFDEGYYYRLAASEFGLCPNHLETNHAQPTWTYRFAECCLVGAIPVLFRATPLDPAFTDGFHYVRDDADSFTYNREHARQNRQRAVERFFLP